MPASANHYQSPTTNRRQTPPTASCRLPTANRRQPPTANCHQQWLSTWSARGLFWENCVTEHFFFSPIRTALFEGKLYFTQDIVGDSFVPRNGKPKPIPKHEATPAPKPVPKGKHVHLFKVRHKVRKGFYSTALDARDGSEDLQNFLKFACTLCSSALLRQLCLG